MIVNRLPQLMAHRGVAIRELSRQTGITYSTIWALVHGRRRSVQLEVLDAVCEALDVKPGDIYVRVTAADEVNAAMVANRLSRPAPGSEKRPARPARRAHNRDSEWRSW